MKVLLRASLVGSLVLSLVFSLTAPIFTTKEEAKALAQEEQKDPIDPRITQLEAFFDHYSSPLKESATTFVQVADLCGIDWRMLPAVAGVESGFGKVLLPNSFNPFGWGGGYVKFASFEDAIFVVGLNLKAHYLAKGADTVEKIALIYCPPNTTKWAKGVRFFMSQIGN